MIIKAGDIAQVIEEFAPLSLQESYDNSGLIVGSYDTETTSAMVCVDITEEVMDEAEEHGIDMIISHHPIIFHPLKRLNGSNYVQRIVERAIKKGITLYACHTNLDSVNGGMSYKAAAQLGLSDLGVLAPVNSTDGNNGDGLGVTGQLPYPMDAEDFLRHLKKSLDLQVIRHSGICRKTVSTIAVCTGSGASLINTAANAGADVYIAADFKYNDFIDADGRLIIADIGHFESEYCAIDLLYGIITKKLPTFAVRKSVNSRNPINYLV